MLAEELTARLFTLPGSIVKQIQDPPPVLLEAPLQQRRATIQRDVSERNARFFASEADKLDGWADDLKAGLEREIKELDRQIKEVRRATSTALTLEEKLAGQKQIKALESQRNQKRRSLFEAQDEVDRQRDELIVAIEGKLHQRSNIVKLFTVRWVLGRGLVRK